MLASKNPFTPSFGILPAHLVGREQIIQDTTRAYEDAFRRPELTTLISGARGTGKTALLSFLSRKAESAGWVSTSVTAVNGMLEDMEIQLRRNAAHLLQSTRHSAVESIGIPNVLSVSLDNTNFSEPSNWRSRISDILDELAARDVGVLFVIDELDVKLEELVQFAVAYQHFVREERRVALLMAGLPHNVSSLLSNGSISFLRRACQVSLLPIPNSEVRRALSETASGEGRSFAADSLDISVNAIKGFPYMLQLVGYYAWDANPSRKIIGREDAVHAVDVANSELETRVLDATFRDLSPEDIRFATAMLADEGNSRLADIAARLNRSSSQVAQYRKRLIDAGVIGSRSRGIIGFDLPYFREYLQGKIDDGELEALR